MKYTKTDLLTDIAAQAGVTRVQAETIVATFINTLVTRTMEGRKVSWPGFGSFQTSQRAARTGRNPQTGETIQIPASTYMKFSAAKGLKDTLNE